MTIDSDSARFSRTLQAAVLWPVGAIFLTAILLLVLVLDLFHTIAWSDHSYQVLAQTRKCETLLIATQNDVRGYLLTGDNEFLKSFEDEKKEADLEVAQLKQMVRDSPEQSIRAQDISRAKDTWYAHAQTMISHRSQDLPANADWVKVGKTLLDDLRSRFDGFIDSEMAVRDARFNRLQRTKMILIYAGGALAILVALFVAHEVRKRMMELAANHHLALQTIEHRQADVIRSEKDLEEQKEWLRVTLTSIGDGVIVTDPMGRVVLMNHEAERLTGWKQGEALHHPVAHLFKIVNEETRTAVADPVQRVLRDKKIVGMANHTLLLSRSGEEWPIDDSAAPICDPKGNVLGVVMVFRDASTTRLVQQKLKAYSTDLEKQVADRTTTLQQMVGELEAFSHSVSHDLRSPLRAMQGFSEAVLEDYGEKLDEQGKNYLERIKNAAGRLDRLIQDLLSYTRISRLDAPLEPCDLNKIVHEIVEHDTSLNPPEAHVEVEKMLPKVLGRESSLNQIITNLLCNAVKFVEKGKMPEIKIRAEDRGPLVRLWIEDNGIGIAPEDQERIFNMFIQVNEASQFGGTGVGLAIVKKAAQTMHGSVGVESKPGEGSRFWVELNKVA